MRRPSEPDPHADPGYFFEDHAADRCHYAGAEDDYANWVMGDE